MGVGSSFPATEETGLFWAGEGALKRWREDHWWDAPVGLLAPLHRDEGCGVVPPGHICGTWEPRGPCFLSRVTLLACSHTGELGWVLFRSVTWCDLQFWKASSADEEDTLEEKSPETWREASRQLCRPRRGGPRSRWRHLMALHQLDL